MMKLPEKLRRSRYRENRVNFVRRGVRIVRYRTPIPTGILGATVEEWLAEPADSQGEFELTKHAPA
jgi:hypothetical protein